MRRLAVARLHFCSNSFNCERTRLKDFQAHEWRVGPEALESADPGSELAGVQAFLAERPEWRATMLRCAAAPPGGPMQADVFGVWLTEIEAALRQERFSGIYLSLHGACQAEGDPTADLTIMRRVRALAGRTPVVATFDAAANLSDETVLLLDAASANRGGESWMEGSGAEAAALRALAMLETILTGEQRPVGTLLRMPSLLASLGAADLLAELYEDGVAGLPPEVLDASLFTGFPWSDSKLAGAGCMVWTDRDASLGRATARALMAGLSRPSPRPAPWRPEAAIAGGLSSGGRFVLLDPADDPLVGGMADTPGMLRALIGIDRPLHTVFAALHDPVAMTAAYQAGSGAALNLSLGGRVSTGFGPPVPLRVTVERLLANSPAGALAVLRSGGTQILVSQIRPQRVDTALLSAAGIDLNGMQVLALKAGTVPEFDLAERFPEILTCACPGPASHDLAGLPFQSVPMERRVAAGQQSAAHR